MQRFRQLSQKFVRDENGATSIEYALIAVIVSISIIAAMTNVRDELQAIIEYAANALSSATDI